MADSARTHAAGVRAAVADCHVQQLQLLSRLRAKIADRQQQEAAHLRESASAMAQLREQEAHALAEQRAQLVRRDSQGMRHVRTHADAIFAVHRVATTDERRVGAHGAVCRGAGAALASGARRR